MFLGPLTLTLLFGGAVVAGMHLLGGASVATAHNSVASCIKPLVCSKLLSCVVGKFQENAPALRRAAGRCPAPSTR